MEEKSNGVHREVFYKKYPIMAKKESMLQKVI